MLDHLIINGINKNERYSFKDEYMLEDLEENYIGSAKYNSDEKFSEPEISMKYLPHVHTCR